MLAVKPQVMPDVLGISTILPHTAARRRVLFSSPSPRASPPNGSPTVFLRGSFRSRHAQHAAARRGGHDDGLRPEDADASDVALVCELFDALGSAFVVDESLMDATGALSGSGPAYVAHMIEALRDAGRDAGIDEALAEKLAFDTVTVRAS